MSWTYTLYVAGLFFAAIISAALAIFAWRRRSLPSSLSFALLMLAVTEWALIGVLEANATDIPTKVLWSKIMYVGIVSVSPLLVMFVLGYTHQDQWLMRHPYRLALLWLPSVATLLIAWTNDLHHALWSHFEPDFFDPHIVEYVPGWWAYVFRVLVYSEIAVAVLALIRAIVRFPNLYRQQAAALLIGAAMPVIGNLAYIFFKGLDWTPITFALTGAALAWGTLRFRLFDLVPVARDVLVENMGDGVLVLDRRNRILDINPAMQQLAGLTESSAIGQPVEQALAAWPDLATHCCGASELRAEITLPGAARYFELRATALRDKQSRPSGRLVTLHEITEHKQTEEKMATINRIGLAATSGLDVQRVLQTLLEQCRQVLPVDAFYVAIYDEPSGMLYHPLFFDRGDYRTVAPRTIWSEPGLSGQVIASRKTLYLPDTLDPETAAEYQIIRTGGEPTRSYVGVPLLARDQTVGVISMQSYQPNAYTPDQIHMLETIATQAATAIENARLFEEAQQRNRRLALINEISVALNQPIELQTVLQSAADGLTRALNVGQVGIALFDETRQHLTIMADHPAPGNASAAGLELPIEGNLSLQRILATQAPLAVDDAQNDPLLSNAREILARQRVCSILIAPLLVRDRVIGTIGCDATDAPRHFTPEEIELAQTIANLVALRIEQARLFEAERNARQQVQKRANDLSGLYAITRATSRSLATEDVLAQALSSALVALGFEAGLIALADPDDPSSGLRVAAERGLPAAVLERLRAKGLEGTLSSYVHDQREILVIEDLEQEQSTALQVMAVKTGMAGWRSFAGIPLLHQEQSQGALCLFARPPRPASRYDVALLSSIGHQVAAAIANARLFQATLSERSRLKALIGASRDGIILATLEGHILITNTPALQMLRLSGQPDDWFGVALQDAISSLRESAPLAFHIALVELERIQTGDAPPTESELEIPPRVLFWQSLPVRVGAWPMGRLFVLRDMTEERAVERMREDMTHTMVHDLRNPLSGISASLDVLTSGVTGEMTLRQHSMLEIAQRSARRMLNIVNAILDVSRLESGRMPLEMEAFSIHELLNEAVQVQAALANDKNLRLECGAPVTLPPAWADTRIIQRVLQNLISNAIWFTPSGGSVHVTAWQEEKNDRSAILVSVRDTGLGIPPEIASRLFQKFVTGGQEESGSGLGLAFCKLAMEAHGERIWVESVPGEGATFTFSLAIANPPAL